MFIDSHYDDDWVVCSNWESFESVDIDIKKSSNGKDLGVFISNSCVKGQLIQEYLGEIDFQKNYQTNASNNYRLMGTTPVSYTHLDVYKRQPIYSLCFHKMV